MNVFVMATFDPQVSELKVSPLLFQPLIENAFKYVDGDYWISISIQKKQNSIHFKIENSVLELTADNKTSKGIGIENLRRRLGSVVSRQTHVKHCSKREFILLN